MPTHSPHDQIFLDKLRALVEQHMSNETFGVSELATEAGMSRSNLLRKLKKLTGLSVSQYIREVRLQEAMRLLQEGSLNVTEVSDQVGFSSTSYFVKCFREQYGYPPGEVGKRLHVQEEVQTPEKVEVSTEESIPSQSKSTIKTPLLIVGGIFVVLLLAVALFNTRADGNDIVLEKSIAVLPFKNDSADSSNVYLVNGLMESTLNNLQKIGDLRVISRTSAEKYRNSAKSGPEIAGELGVSYFVEGSGQKVGDRILLNIQLIEATTDKHLWAAQYERDSKDIFKIQQEIASNIASEVRAIITPEERRQITKIPTSNLVAYDNYLKGKNLLVMGDLEKLNLAKPYFEKAIELDEDFSKAYAALTICYFYLDLFQSQKAHEQNIKDNADKAMELDANSPESLMAIALYYQYIGDYPEQVKYLERALELSPNNVEIINMLSDLYANYMPDTNKYLEYALRGIQLNNEGYDSLTTSYLYLHLSNALIQTGFVDEALYYVNRSLDYSQNNGFSNYVKAFVQYGQDKNEASLRKRLVVEWKKDSSRLDILQEIGKVSFFMGEFDSAYYYYKIFLDIREENNLDIYRHEHGKIGAVFDKLGMKEKADEFYQDYFEFIKTDQTIYQDLNYYAYYAYRGETEKALEYLRRFSQKENYQFWLILFDKDPQTDALDRTPEAQRLWKIIKDKFWANHNALRADLEKKGLL